MTALTCDICGGKLKMRKGKIAVCESCGMEHNLERVKEKVQEIKGTIHTDSAHLIENFFSMAQDAYNADNFQEAEKYCNKIIEINANHYEALLLKGKAIGWSANLSNNRFKEVASCFANAINSISNDKQKNKIFRSVEKEFESLITALLNLRSNHFLKWIDQEDADGFYNDLDEVTTAISLFEKETQITIDRNKVFANVVTTIKSYICQAITNKIIPEFKFYKSKESYWKFVRRTDECIRILEKTVELCDDDNKSDIEIYKLIIDMLMAIINNNSMDFECNHWGAYIQTPRLSNAEIKARENKIHDIELKIERLNKLGS